jgi:hypothetical protein
MNRLRLLAVMLGVLLGAGCAVDAKFSQAQLDAIQTRELDTSAERAYFAVVGTMLEQDYQIMESDLEGGVLVARSTTGDTMNGFRHAIVQITVVELSRMTTNVRISTSTNGQTRVDETLIRRLHERIDVHAHTPVTDLVWEPVS